MGCKLERFAAIVDFDVFCAMSFAWLALSVHGRGCRPPHHSAIIHKILLLQAVCSSVNEAIELQIKDRLSFQRFLGFGIDGTMLHATTI